MCPSTILTVSTVSPASNGRERILREFRKRGGWARTSEVAAAGIHGRWLSRLIREGEIERVRKGLYRVVSAPTTTDETFATVCRAVPEGVVCLLSALAYHQLTTSNPSEIYVAMPKDEWLPRISYPPVRYFRFSAKLMAIGVEQHRAGGGTFRIFDREKTICDAFRHWHVVGRDIALEALRSYVRGRPRRNVDRLLEVARECRVDKRLRPYLEALL